MTIDVIAIDYEGEFLLGVPLDSTEAIGYDEFSIAVDPNEECSQSSMACAFAAWP